ncbi:MAG: T9SS type A sorting domain-containing protein [Bacteroidia bacterium]|nr:T9SS type A sorting domain-containing protein [Bacteroidia bacterium]MDW8089590.1 T9SS type A sorting domain-containing protein [Bacteroidia bacterium]
MRGWWAIGLLSLIWAQTNTCPYVRYILFDACSGSEGNDEFLILWSGSGFNTNQLQITFPNPATTTWCNSTCGLNNLSQCNNALIDSWNTTCGSNVFQCVGANVNIPPNSWVILFTGYQNANPYPNPSNLCGAGTVYVMFANNTNAQGRYLNNPTDAENRRTIINFSGRPECSMTINYRNISPGQNGNYLLIDPTICIGRTEGQNNVRPSTDACYYASSTDRNGVSLGNVGANCPLPPTSVLPILWAYVQIEGDRLVWQATGTEGEEGAHLTLWHTPEVGRAWQVVASELPLTGQYPLREEGFYRLSAPLRNGAVEYSPILEYRRGSSDPLLYPNPAPGGPYLLHPEQVQELEVIENYGSVIVRLTAPISMEALRGLPPGLYVVRFFGQGRERVQRLLVLP